MQKRRADAQLSHYGHAKMAELVSAYIDSTDCSMRASETPDEELAALYPLTETPRVRLRYKDGPV